MASQWPPSPSVEDEETALARELGFNRAVQHAKSDEPPAHSRGSVDQYPIILENASKGENNVQGQWKCSKTETNSTNIDSQSSDESSGPATPPSVNKEKRYVFLPATQSNEDPTPPFNRPLSRSKSTTRLTGDETPRGRPQISRIQTDVGSGLHEVVAGRRRVPSPYSYHATPASSLNQSAARQARTSFLSPSEAASPRTTTLNSRRAKSAHPERNAGIDSSDSEHRSARRRHHSRTRTARESSLQPKHSSGADALVPNNLRDTPTRSPTFISSSLPVSQRSSRSNITPPHSPRLTRESPYASAAEDFDHRSRPGGSRAAEKNNFRDSPHTSSAEESSHHSRDLGRRQRDGKAPRSRRNSVRQRDKQQLDDYDLQRVLRDNAVKDGRTEQRRRGGQETPVSARTPTILENDLERAFQDNERKRSKPTPRYSANPSPLTSPPTSPPRTARGDRRSQDYFEISEITSQPTKQQPRPPPVAESPTTDVKPMTSMLGATIHGASVAAKAIPHPPRSSVASVETLSSGPQSGPASGQRSRRPSPVYEEPRPVSRAGSYSSREERPLPRASTYPPRDERPVSRDSNHSLAPEPPRLPQRALSYSSPVEQALQRPPLPNRTYSTAISAPAQSLQTTMSTAAPRLIHSSPTSSERVPSLGSLAPRIITLSACLRPRPVAGLHDWYTIRHMPHLDFCPSCMGTLGNSWFRDLFIPSLHKPANQSVACAMSVPWIRIAWAQTLKQNRSDLRLVQELSSALPPEIRPCPGPRGDVRQWWHLIDPRGHKPVPDFDVCSACVRNIDLAFPELGKHLMFQRPKTKLSQERICNLNTSSKHFSGIIGELEKLAKYKRANDLLEKDLTKFVDHIRKIARLKDCARDTMLATQTWHFMPELPEFTICEGCFNDVVWPLKDKPIAMNISKITRIVPVARRGPVPMGISCQLYSDRMRSIFREAVNRSDFPALARAARLRYDTEHSLQETQRLYEQDQRRGIDRRIDMERNAEIWKSFE